MAVTSLAATNTEQYLRWCRHWTPCAHLVWLRLCAIIVTGGTLIAGAKALREAGATEVYACATHALIPDHAFEKLGQSELREIAVTDTVPLNPIHRPNNLPPPLTVSLLLADTIKNVFSDESVSAIFAGENQLF